ncbi:MAG: TMEM198/TM7SF3 family protein [Microthrixaceae bacterium]|nr:TMEM198/TM7SF3 family protein [Microthrixaceae bacterium]HPB45877.1 DUF4203 domain-containing protein [Microthrixaceae bacterium]
MADIALGLVAIIAGAAFCFAGYQWFRLIIPVWGFFAGFSAGTGLISAITGDAVLATPLGWILGLVLAVVFATFAYLYYSVAIVMAMSSIGFMLGGALMTALGVPWNWAIAIVGILVGVAFAFAGIVSNLPRVVLVVVSAIGGATAIVGGLMLFGSTLDTEDFSRAVITETINDSWGWWLLYAVLTIAGIMTQSAIASTEDELRAAWMSVDQN